MKIEDFEIVFSASRPPTAVFDDSGEAIATLPEFTIQFHQCPKCGAACAQTGVTEHIAWHSKIEGREHHPSAQTCDMSECSERAVHCKVGEAGDLWLCDKHWQWAE